MMRYLAVVFGIFEALLCDPSWAQTNLTLLGAGSGTGAASTCAYPLPLGSETIVSAHSFRKLRAAYPGAAMTVRRVSDGNTQAIGFAANGCDFDSTAFNTFCNATPCFRSIWNDQTGNGHDLVQVTSANQPQILTAQFGSLPGAKYTPTQFETATAFATGADLSVLLVGTLHATTGNPTPFSIENTSNQNMSIITNGTTSLICRRQGAFDGTFAPTPTLDTLFQLSCRIGASISEIYVNQVHGTDNTGAFSAGGTTSVNAGAGSNTGSTPLNGFLNEVLFFAPGISSGNRTAVSNNQKTYWCPGTC